MRIEPPADPFAPFDPPPPAESGTQPKDEFLRLLVAQLEHQDPLEPQSGAEFVAQLAEFASIELGMETNQRLAGIEAGQASLTSAAMTDMVGKTVTARIDQLRLSGEGDVPPLSLDLDGAAQDVQVIIRDEAGLEVQRISMGSLAEGEHALGWDGTDANGAPLPPGDYEIEIVATAADGSTVDAHATAQGLVDSLSFVDGETLFAIGGLEFAPADILTVTETDPNESPQDPSPQQ